VAAGGAFTVHYKGLALKFAQHLRKWRRIEAVSTGVWIGLGNSWPGRRLFLSIWLKSAKIGVL
jgi:hypothetical protein